MAAELKYTSEHEWIRIEGDTAWIGITEYAQNALGDLVYVELPEVGRTLEKGDDFAVVESVKTAAEVYTPVSGEVVEVNDNLPDNPEQIKAGIEEGWIAKIKIADPAQLDDLMDESKYEEFKAGLE